MKNLNHYPILGRLFRYPTEDLVKNIEEAREALMNRDPGLVAEMEPFFTFVSEKPLAVQQEYYTSTFDVQPLTTLDIGYVLFGDEYRRGVFLVNMQREHINSGNDYGKELPDHLPDILNLLPRISDEVFAEELVCSIMIPALEEMIRRFRNRENHYRILLEILLAVMKADYPSSDFEKFRFGVKTKVQ